MGRELKVKGSMDVERVACYLNQLADSLAAGTVSLQTGKDSIVLNPASPVWVEVEAERSKNKEAFSIEVSWASAERYAGRRRVGHFLRAPRYGRRGRRLGNARRDHS